MERSLSSIINEALEAARIQCPQECVIKYFIFTLKNDVVRLFEDPAGLEIKDFDVVDIYFYYVTGNTKDGCRYIKQIVFRDGVPASEIFENERFMVRLSVFGSHYLSGNFVELRYEVFCNGYQGTFRVYCSALNWSASQGWMETKRIIGAMEHVIGHKEELEEYLNKRYVDKGGRIVVDEIIAGIPDIWKEETFGLDFWFLARWRGRILNEGKSDDCKGSVRVYLKDGELVFRQLEHLK